MKKIQAKQKPRIDRSAACTHAGQLLADPGATIVSVSTPVKQMMTDERFDTNAINGK